MAESKFSGDITGISERQLEFIDKTLTEHGFKGEKLVFAPVGKVGDNYVANVKRIAVETDDGTKTVIAKVAPTNVAHRMATNVHVLFKNEDLMYTKVLPKFTEIQKRADTPAQDMLRYAKCYGSLCEEPNEVILLEDLTTSDFTMLNKLESLSDACVKSVLRNFGILHSLSYVLKKEEPTTFISLTADLVDVWAFSENYEAMTAYFKQMENDVLAVLDDEEHKNTVRHKLSEIINIASKVGKSDIGTKYTIIQQGDVWTNNIMFKIHNEFDVDSIMIDYQVSKENSPVCDILYMIFNCTDHETRSKHYHEWIQYYHAELERSLSNFGLKANFVYPFDKLEADLKRYGKLYFCLSLILAGVITMTEKDAEKFKARTEDPNGAPVQLDDIDQGTVSRYKKRVIGLIESFKEFGLM